MLAALPKALDTVFMSSRFVLRFRPPFFWPAAKVVDTPGWSLGLNSVTLVSQMSTASSLTKKKENRAHRFKWRISPSNVSSGDRGPSTSQARTGNVPKLAKQIPPKDSVKLLNAE